MGWTVTNAADFARHAEAWDAVNAVGGHPLLLASRFVRPLLEAFGTGTERLAIHQRGGTVTAMTLLVKNGRASWQTFYPPQAPLGLWVQRPEENLADLLTGLVPALPGVGLLVSLLQQDPDARPRPDGAARIVTRDSFDTGRVTVTGTWDEYWKARGKNLRHNLKRQQNLLGRDGTTAHLDILTTPEEMAEAVRDYGALESAGWKGKDGSAVHEGNAQGKFYRAMLEEFARSGQARAYRYRFNDRVVAVDLCLVAGREMVNLKTTYDETVKHVSPALLLRHDYFRSVFEEGGIGRIEFFGPVMDWHTKWTEEVRRLYHVNAYRWGWLRRAHEWWKRPKPASEPTPDPSTAPSELQRAE